MKFKLTVSEARYAEIAEWLVSHGGEIDDTADLTITEKNIYVSYLIGRRGEEFFRLKTCEISHIESFSHEIVAHCGGEECRLTETLRRLESILDPAEFLRVSNSVIVSLNHIRSIRPALSQKFVLTMSDGSKVDVTRSYYYGFKDTLGI